MGRADYGVQPSHRYPLCLRVRPRSEACGVHAVPWGRGNCAQGYRVCGCSGQGQEVNTKEKFYKAFFITSSENILRVLASFTIFLLFATSLGPVENASNFDNSRVVVY